MQQVWIRKIRRYGNERAVQIPKEIAANLPDFVVLTVIDRKITILPLEQAVELGILKNLEDDQ